jgi:hypothetical protein
MYFILLFQILFKIFIVSIFQIEFTLKISYSNLQNIVSVFLIIDFKFFFILLILFPYIF